eukprot:7213197-Lingulodinium_polyedra.AAC.1
MAPDYNFARDYMVPVPSTDYRAVQRTPMKTNDLAVLSRALLSELAIPTYGPMPGLDPTEASAQWYCESTTLLVEGGAACWTEHSERNFLASLGAPLGLPRELRDLAGRWKQDGAAGSLDY